MSKNENKIGRSISLKPKILEFIRLECARTAMSQSDFIQYLVETYIVNPDMHLEAVEKEEEVDILGDALLSLQVDNELPTAAFDPPDDENFE